MGEQKLTAIPPSEWQWFGCAAHFICGRDCRFHLATKIADVLVSTVGEYLPGEGIREILAKSRGIELEGKGDAREADYMNKVGYEEIGWDRKYETMVFRAGAICTAPDCNCGLPELLDGQEIDFAGYNDAGSATRGHLEICQRWAEKGGICQNN